MELTLGRLVELEGGERVVRHWLVALVERRDTDDGLAARHVELHYILAEKDVSHQQPLHALGRGLHARLVGFGKVPAVEGDLPCLLPDLHPEGTVLLPMLGKVVPRHVGQLPLHAVSRDDQARRARIHDRGCAIVLLRLTLPLEQLHGRILRVAKLERGHAHNEVIRCKCGGVPHGAVSGGGVIASKLNLRLVVGREEGELPVELSRVGVFVLLVSHGKENGGWEIGSRLRETEAEDAVDAIEIGRVTVRDDTEGRSCLVVAHVDLVHAREAA
mmetsp:Transcript_18062/g.28872  ORF Transcript_18062/g.28872 Transcript_18062/m.28872 type:complete len:273 (-) Transcript_18062:451-1269(-)